MHYTADTALIYDLFTAPDRSPEADLWQSLAGPAPADLLEAMAGSAEVAGILASRGYRVTGVELSAAMLRQAEARRAALEPQTASRLTLVQADICQVDLPDRAFDLAYVGNGSFHLLLSPVDRDAALQAIRRALRPGGRLALSLFRPLTSSGRSEPRSFQPFRPAPAGLTVEKRSVVERDSLTQQMRIYERLNVNGRITEQRLDLQILDPDQITREAEQAGFSDIQLYGSPRLAPYDETAELLLVTARA